MIIAALERTGDEEDEPPKNLTEEEFQYTTRMIETNLSNFSAWHNRSKLIPRLLTFRKASETERRKFLDSGKCALFRAQNALANQRCRA